MAVVAPNLRGRRTSPVPLELPCEEVVQESLLLRLFVHVKAVAPASRAKEFVQRATELRSALKRRIGSYMKPPADAANDPASDKWKLPAGALVRRWSRQTLRGLSPSIRRSATSAGTNSSVPASMRACTDSAVRMSASSSAIARRRSYSIAEIVTVSPMRAIKSPAAVRFVQG